MPTRLHFSLPDLLCLLTDLAAIAVVLIIGWFLIGYYSKYQFLDVNYQDWMSHAFRIESIQKHGMTSWDSVWDNGINYWRSYQYLPHLFALGVIHLTGLSVPQAMLVSIVIIFLFVRVSTYVFLRQLKVSPLIALFATVSSYAFEQQWVAIKDYTLFMAMGLLPMFVFLWILALKHRRYFD